MIEVPVNQSPWRGLLRVQTELGGRCTGFLVAPAVAMTAAHCLFRPASGRFVQAGSVHVLLRYRRGRFDAHARVRRFVVPPGYDPGRQQATAAYDRAVLLLDHAVAPQSEALSPWPGLPPLGARLLLAGYGQDREELAVSGVAPCRLTGLTQDGAGHALLLHDCPGTRGTSGAPLLVRGADGIWRVAGVQIEATWGASGGLAAPLAAIPSGRSSDK